MSELLQRIKNDKNIHRKAAVTSKDDPAKQLYSKTCSSILTTLIGELETKSKASGKETTDTDVLAAIKKFLKGIEEILALGSNPASEIEKKCLESYLPSQMSEEEIRSVISRIHDPRSVGEIMTYMKTTHNGQYDGSLVSKIAKEFIG